MFHRLEMRRACGVIHDRLRYSQIVTDLQIDKGIIVAVSDGAGNEAMAFAEVGSEIHVLDLPASSPEAEEAVLGVLRAKAGEKSIIVMGYPLRWLRLIHTAVPNCVHAPCCVSLTWKSTVGSGRC